MKYNLLNSIFKEGDVTLKVIESPDNGRTCHGCWYNGCTNRVRNYPYSCCIHGHVCTPALRKDKKQVIFIHYTKGMINRSYYNGLIIGVIAKALTSNPQLRFCQLLSILKLDKDNFYEEPDKTYARICNDPFFKKYRST